jgi:hypothetical protein
MKSHMVNFVLLCIIAILVAGCVPESDWVIPADFSTFEDESGLFSISYPSDWQVNLEVINQLKSFVAEYVQDVDESISIDQASILFLAGVPERSGYHPNVNIVIEPLPFNVRSIGGLLDAQLAGLRSFAEDFNEISREKVKVNGRTVYILEYEATFPNMGVIHALILTTMADGNGWTVTCSSLEGLDDYDQHADDFQSIVRSLRIH